MITYCYVFPVILLNESPLINRQLNSKDFEDRVYLHGWERTEILTATWLKNANTQENTYFTLVIELSETTGLLSSSPNQIGQQFTESMGIPETSLSILTPFIMEASGSSPRFSLDPHWSSALPQILQSCADGGSFQLFAGTPIQYMVFVDAGKIEIPFFTMDEWRVWSKVDKDAYDKSYLRWLYNFRVIFEALDTLGHDVSIIQGNALQIITRNKYNSIEIPSSITLNCPQERLAELSSISESVDVSMHLDMSIGVVAASVIFLRSEQVIDTVNFYSLRSISHSSFVEIIKSTINNPVINYCFYISKDGMKTDKNGTLQSSTLPSSLLTENLYQ